MTRTWLLSWTTHEATEKSGPRGLTRELAVAVTMQVRKTSAYQEWRLLGVSVLANRVDVLVSLPQHLDELAILQDLKVAANRILNRCGNQSEICDWWAHGGSTQLKAGRQQIESARAYIRNQPEACCVWLDDGFYVQSMER